MEEKIFYQNGDVRVTQSRFIVGDKTFALRNISSVQVGLIGPNRTLYSIVVLIGALSLLAEQARLFGAIVLIIAVIYIFTVKSGFSVRITINSGETDCLFSKDKKYVGTIVNALNDAIIELGRNHSDDHRRV